MKNIAVSALVILLMVGCGEQASVPANTAGESALPPIVLPYNPELSSETLSLPVYFNCLRQNGGVAIAAHRGGPAPGYPENAIETMQYNFDRGVRVFEIDVAETRDGVLTLMHDDRVNRTTNGSGYVSDTSWEEMSGLKLVDNDGKRTNFSPPKLTDALIWARDTGAILELDRKRSTSFRNIAAAVQAARAYESAIFISYTDEEAAQIAAIDNRYMMTASARGSRDIGRLEDLGVDRARLIAWTGTREPDEAAWDRNAREGVESAFGTLGRAGERLDDVYMADGDGSEFQNLADMGLVILATDRPLDAAAAMIADDTGISACPR